MARKSVAAALLCLTIWSCSAPAAPQAALGRPVYDMVEGPQLGRGLRKPCNRTCHGSSVPATVLDPFAGSGTTGVVARRLGRRSLDELLPVSLTAARSEV